MEIIERERGGRGSVAEICWWGRHKFLKGGHVSCLWDPRGVGHSKSRPSSCVS